MGKRLKYCLVGKIDSSQTVIPSAADPSRPDRSRAEAEESLNYYKSKGSLHFPLCQGYEGQVGRDDKQSLYMNRFLVLLITISIVFFSFSPTKAALSFSDTLSDSRPFEVSNHEIKWTVADAGGIAEGESFTLTFASGFDTSSITVGDVDLLDDGADITLAAACGGSQASFVNNGNDTFTFTICPGGGGAIATTSVVTVRIGTNATGGVNQIISPAAGSYTVSLAGAGGYTDSSVLQVNIIGGVSTTATVTAQTGNLHIVGYASPSALIYFLENSSVIATNTANSNSYFDETINGLAGGIHTINIYARDSDNRNSVVTNINVNISSGSTVNYGPVIIAPTFSIPTTSIGRPAELNVNGKAVNNSSVEISINGSRNDGTNFSVTTDGSGSWSANINPLLHLGEKSVYFVAVDRASIKSEPSNTTNYTVVLSADLNNDGKVNDLDFDILKSKWQSRDNVAADINDDGVVNITDLSIMMYYWTT